MAHSSAVTAGGEPREDGDDDVFYTMEKNARDQLASQSNGHSSKTKTIDRYGFIVGPNAPQSPTV